MKAIIARWGIEFDPNATARCHEQAKIGWNCDCLPCRNFLALDKSAFSSAALDLLERLGVDYKKPAEVYHNARLENGLHNYGGWFHFVGKIESGADALKQIGDTPCEGTFELEQLGEHFQFGFSNCLGLVRESFRDQSLIQLEFSTNARWVLRDSEPS